MIANLNCSSEADSTALEATAAEEYADSTAADGAAAAAPFDDDSVISMRKRKGDTVDKNFLTAKKKRVKFLKRSEMSDAIEPFFPNTALNHAHANTGHRSRCNNSNIRNTSIGSSNMRSNNLGHNLQNSADDQMEEVEMKPLVTEQVSARGRAEICLCRLSQTLE